MASATASFTSSKVFWRAGSMASTSNQHIAAVARRDRVVVDADIRREGGLQQIGARGKIDDRFAAAVVSGFIDAVDGARLQAHAGWRLRPASFRRRADPRSRHAAGAHFRRRALGGDFRAQLRLRLLERLGRKRRA